MTKDQIRRDMKQQRDMLSPEEQQQFSNTIRQRLLQTDCYRSCIRLFIFLSFQTEVDTYGIIGQALKDQKQVFLPRVEQKKLEFYEIKNTNNLVLSKYGILEPASCETLKYVPFPIRPGLSKATDAIPQETINHSLNANLMVLPGLAFDLRGNRIGYGAGYYDRYLSEFTEEHFYKIAVAYDFQLMDRLPAEEFDVRMDEIITPSRRIKCGF